MSESKRLMLLGGRLCLILIIILEVSYAIRGIASIPLERWAIAFGATVTLLYWLLTDTPKRRRGDEAN